MLLDEPETSVLVQELALAAVEGVGAAAHVQRHGHGWYEIEVAQGRYVRTNPKLRGPAYRRE